MGAAPSVRSLLVAMTVSSCEPEQLLVPAERLRVPGGAAATIPTPVGNPVAVNDTITTWPHWMVPVQVLANDTGLVDVVTASARTGSAVPYHHSFVNYTPMGIGSDVVAYTAMDSATTTMKGALLFVTVAPAPPAADLQLTAGTYTTPGRLHVILRSSVAGATGVPASGLRSDQLSAGVVFRTRQNDRCVADLPLGKVSCYRPGIAVGVARTDTLTFTASGWVTLAFTLASPASDPVPANNRAVVTAYVP